MVQRKKFDVILRLLVERYRRTKPPKPDASQFVVPARLPKPVIGSGGLSSSRFDVDVSEVNCTWTASFSWRVKEAAPWFESHGSKNLTGGTTWSSQSTSTDWLTRTHRRSSPRSKLAYKKPTKYQKVTKISWDVWSRFEASWLDCVTMMSEMTIAVIVASASCHHLTRADSGWSRIPWFSRVTLPWLRGGTSVAPWRHKSSHVPVFRRLFDRLPVRISTSDLHHRILRKKLYHIRAYDFGVQFSFNACVSSKSLCGGWADVGLWVAVCFLAKISLHRSACKTTFARLTQSQAISQSFRAFISFRSRRDTTFFSFFETLFYTKLPFPLPWWSKDLLVDKPCRWRAINFEIHLWSSGKNADCIFGDRSASSMSKWRPAWTLTPEMIHFRTKSVTLRGMLIDLLTSTM